MYINRRRPSRAPAFFGITVAITLIVLALGIIHSGSPSELFAAVSETGMRLGQPVFAPATATFAPLVTETPTPRPTSTPRPTKTPTVAPTLVPTATPFTVVEHFLLGRPVPSNAYSTVATWTFLYGSTQHGDTKAHHGIDFYNEFGTPLLAVADGTVVVAGDDRQPLCGDNFDQPCSHKLDFYGNVVVIQLDQTYRGQRVFTLYGHMQSIDVEKGQRVRAGDKIGGVGNTGIAEGAHLHFEVRLGVNDYAHTRNPALWMKPLPGYGTVAGRVLDRNGNPLRGINIFVYTDQSSNDYLQDTETYGKDPEDIIPPVTSDQVLQENWAIGDLRAGKYLLIAQVGGLSYQRHITIESGRLTFVVFGGE